MVYFTLKAPPHYRQMSLEDLLFGPDSIRTLITRNETNTITYEREKLTERVKSFFLKEKMISSLEDFCTKTERLRSSRRESLYNTFYIPKRSGGLRRIDAPLPELMGALRNLKDILSDAPMRPGAMVEAYHTSAFAYIHGRSTIDAVKRHQSNESQWFSKFDLSNFFGSTTPDFLLSMLSMIFPYSEIMNDGYGRSLMTTAIDLCFKDGGLPQGTPISPFLTNLMMIPIDFKLANAFRKFETPTGKQNLVYTRYADDFIVSSRYGFSYRQAEGLISSVLAEFGAPFRINTKKTRYGSRSGSNWNLGVMLNKDNEITVGHKKKKQFESMLHAYCMDKKNHVAWDTHDVQVLEGLRSYYTMIEGEVIDRIVAHVGGKCGINIREQISMDLME